MAKYMMATKAFAKLGEISSKEPQLCVIYGEDGENYIGNWVGGHCVDVKFPKSTTRELTEKEAEEYHGMGVHYGGGPVIRIYTKKPAGPDPKKSPVIKLPRGLKGGVVVAMLGSKLAEYRLRYDPGHHPGMQMGTVCKIAVLERLLEKKKVKTWDLSLELAEKYGSHFDEDDFNNACAVIKDYCKTGGKNVHGGTGIKSP